MASCSIGAFLEWARQQHGLVLGRVHTHHSGCFANNSPGPVCGYASGTFEPLCVPSGALVSLFMNQETISGAQQSVLLQLVMDGRHTESGARRIPTEQDVMRALNAWQPHPGLSCHPSACVLGRCFCCDAAQALSENVPFLAAMHSIVEQVGANETNLLDALSSAFAFGLLVAQLMRQQVQ